jgi:L-rhamnose isomerase
MDQAYQLAKQRYATWGIDTDAAILQALNIPVSLHCWQADDNVGFERRAGEVAGGGILATGNHPGRARTGDEMRADLATAMSLIPGITRVNLHSYYAEFAGPAVDRDQLTPAHFEKWMVWAAERKIALDFNASFHAHPLAESGYTLSSADEKVRQFWIRHARAARQIAQAMAIRQGSPCHINFWIPDGAKDLPSDRWSPRTRLAQSYDAIFADESIDSTRCLDFVESKLFGIGSEEYVVGSAEFYTNYALSRKIGLCMDMGHYHPTETIHDKISGHLPFQRKLLLHVSRPLRWDSDHVVIFNDDLRSIFLEVARGQAWDRTVFALDFFDASLNRVAAYVIGTRATRKAALYALLDPTAQLRAAEQAGNHARKLALMDEMKTMPFGAVWDMLCARASVPAGTDWIDKMEQYEQLIVAQRTAPAR